MTGAEGGAGLLGGAMLALACVPLLARGPAARRAAFAQAVLLAVALAGRGMAGGEWSGPAGAAALLAAGWGMLRLRAGDGPREGARERAGTVAAGLALVVLGAEAARRAALLQGVAVRGTLGLALAVVLLGLLAASLRRDPAARGAAMATGLHGVVLAALGLPGSAGAGPVALAVAAMSGLLAAAVSLRRAGADAARDGAGEA